MLGEVQRREDIENGMQVELEFNKNDSYVDRLWTLLSFDFLDLQHARLLNAYQKASTR